MTRRVAIVCVSRMMGLLMLISISLLTGSWAKSPNDTNVTTLNILMLHSPQLNMTETVYVIQMVEDRLRQAALLPTSLQFNFIYRSSCTTSAELYQSEPVKETADVYCQYGRIDAIFGPHCSTGMKQIAGLAGQWNIPVIGYDAVNSLLSNRQLYSTLSRVCVILSSLGQATTTLLNHFKWAKVGIVRDDGNFFGMWIYNEVRTKLEMNNITITVDVNVSANNIDTELPLAWEQLKTKARIIIIAVRYMSYKPFMEAMGKYNMTQPGFLYLVPSAPTDMNIGKMSEMEKKAYSKSLLITGQGQDQELTEQLQKEITQEYGVSFDPQGSSYYKSFYPLIYDSFYMYMRVAGKLASQNKTHVLYNGTAMYNKFIQRTFIGTSGRIWLDEVAERIPSYNVRTIYKGLEKKVFLLDVYSRCIGHCVEKDGQTFGKLIFDWKPKLKWKKVRKLMEIPLLDEPVCGFTDEKCDKTNIYIGIGIAILSVVILLFVWWRYKASKEAELHRMAWRVTASSMVKARKQNSMLGSMESLRSKSSKTSSIVAYDAVLVGSDLVNVNEYKQNRQITFKRSQLVMLNQLKSIQNENLSPFVGICFNETSAEGENDMSILWKLGTRGTLEDILLSMELNLESVFQASFTRDIIKGLEYIHQSPVKSHGGLNANTCLVTSQWIIKLSGFGLQDILYDLAEDHDIEYTAEKASRLLLVAPELLRERETIVSPMPSSQEGDIYSLGLLLYEIIYRQEPFDEVLGMTSAKETLNQLLINPNQMAPKPHMPIDAVVDKQCITLIKSCWNDKPEKRPTLQSLKTVSKKLSPMKGSLVDNMISMMEKYAANLEKLVKDRTSMLEEAQHQADQLLFRMLPVSVALELKAGNPIEPKSFSSATVCFCDIVSFTTICAESTPLQVVNFLNSLFSGFDQIIEDYKAYKVETVGDAYMLVSGVPVLNGNQHGYDMATIALLLRDFTAQFEMSHQLEKNLEVRIGIDTGPVAAGVIGLSAPRYCLFGNTVNVASRMESTSMPMKIQATGGTRNLLEQYPAEFQFIERGQVNIKGKGILYTYWLEKGPAFASK